MFRKLLLSGITALAFMTPLAFTSTAQAHDEPYRHHYHHARYAVVYRAYPFGYWQTYGVFGSRHTAHEVAESLRFQGFNARVVYR
jgi:hypothetical protein